MPEGSKCHVTSVVEIAAKIGRIAFVPVTQCTAHCANYLELCSIRPPPQAATTADW